MREYVVRHRVMFDETNVVGNVYFAHYLHWQGHCREAFLADHAPGVLHDVCAGELVMVTVSCSMEYFAEVFALDVIEIGMTLSGSRGNRVEMDYEFRREGRLVARGQQAVSCLRRTENGVLPIRVPDELSRALSSYGVKATT
ncbi:acyl-CoA thioesterase [Amycolatopsis rhizosphaerae]|uniref:Acyl-CoA thioesterase n=1 Tax=Amycolatopsis rhizosphaerae TaxID=2053003 RepID=A0A558DKD3_9PSEU|nr:thioesterase family protein [Amycolatopsis rhizosphaerae]TVT61479.1 acyl-CoA thioesterase [Amycolatopsis rhizosphaerae]